MLQKDKKERKRERKKERKKERHPYELSLLKRHNPFSWWTDINLSFYSTFYLSTDEQTHIEHIKHEQQLNRTLYFHCNKIETVKISVLCTSITVWFSSATKSDLRRLRRVVRTAERIIDTTLPTLQELYLSRVSKRVGKITLDPSHPAHSLFELLPSGRRYRALSARTTRHRNSFFPRQSISWTLDIKRGTHNT